MRRRVCGVVEADDAGALLFRGQRDTQAARLETRLKKEGVMAVLRAVCGLDEADPFARAVAERYRGYVFTEEGVVFPPAHTPEAVGDGRHIPMGMIR
jgi:hypothetical protein